MLATGSILLDTSVVVAALRRIAGLEAKLEAASQRGLPLFALGELEYGVSRSSHRIKQSSFSDFRNKVVAFRSKTGTLTLPIL